LHGFERCQWAGFRNPGQWKSALEAYFERFSFDDHTDRWKIPCNLLEFPAAPEIAIGFPKLIPPPKMNKAELVLAVQKSLGKEASKAESERAVQAVIDGIKTGLKKDQSVQLVGFGTFKVSTRKARTGINPSTKQKMKIKASKVVRFSAGKDLKAKVK